ncbi:MAG: DUF177 domain-containing protein [Sphingomonadaceae bacterium]
MTPEFARRVALDAIGAGGHAIGVEANADERAALALRFGWLGITRLVATARLLARAGGVDALGRFEATIERACVASGEPVHETVEEAFGIHFVPLALVAETATDEIELNEDALDIIEFEGAAIDIGEAVAQSLALAVDPFPRSPAADAKLRAAGVIGEGEEPGAFAGLKDLLKR